MSNINCVQYCDYDGSCAAGKEIDSLKVELAKLRAIIEDAKRESRGWATGGYPEPFMRLAAMLYHVLDAGRGEEKE